MPFACRAVPPAVLSLLAAWSLAGAGCGAPVESADGEAAPGGAGGSGGGEPLGEAAEAILGPNSVAGLLGPKQLVLTYDDGPDDLTLPIAIYLAAEGIRATFFINGRRICPPGQSTCASPPPNPNCALTGEHGNVTAPYNQKMFPDTILSQLQTLGHQIANHTQDHCNLDGGPQNTAQAGEEIRATQDILDRYQTGYRFFRAPYGAWPAAAAADAQQDLCLDKVVGHVHWQIDPGDWANWANGEGVGAAFADFFTALMAQANQKGIVLLHDRPEYNTDDVPAYYPPSQDNTLELTKRIVAYAKDNGYAFRSLDQYVGSGKVTSWGQCGQYSDAFGWASSQTFYGTLRLADVTGDGLADVCGRGGGGLWCQRNTGRQEFAAATVWSSGFSDGSGFGDPARALTVRYGDLNHDGKADVCARKTDGVHCALSNGTSFGTLTKWSTGTFLSDADGWAGSPSYYRSMDLGDVDGDGYADVCARGSGAVQCARNTRSGQFGPHAVWQSENFTNAQGWMPTQYGATVQLADVNGDGRADVCGRGGSGLRCALSTGTAFGTSFVWTQGGSFGDGDASGSWTTEAYWGSLRFGDVNGDGKADVCGRGHAGVRCARTATGSSFASAAVDLGYADASTQAVEFTNGAGWGALPYATTMMLGRLDASARADVCLRSVRGLRCALTN